MNRSRPPAGSAVLLVVTPSPRASKMCIRDSNHAIKDALDLVGLPYKDKKLFSQYSLGMKHLSLVADNHLTT